MLAKDTCGKRSELKFNTRNSRRWNLREVQAALALQVHGSVGDIPIIGTGVRCNLAGGQPLLVVLVDSGEPGRQAVASTLPQRMFGLRVVVESARLPELCCRLFRTPGASPGVAIRAGDDGRIGTLGCFVQLAGSNDVFALTCEHVMANSAFRYIPGVEVQWARNAASPPLAWRKLGLLSPLTHGIDYVNNHAAIDAALVRVTERWAARPLRIGRVSPDPIDEYEAVARTIEVRKYGATTGLTHGRVRGIMDILVQLRDGTGSPVKRIRYPQVLEVITTERRWALCDRGDSGAVFWDHNDGLPARPVGLLCSTHLGYKGYAIPITRVLDSLQARVIA